MKPKTNFLFLFACIFLLFINCSSDDDAGEIIEDPINEDPISQDPEPNYFPLVLDNEWQYENKQTADDETQESSETLSVEDENESDNGATFQLNSTSEDLAVSFTSILSNGVLSKNENQLLLTGDFDIDLDQQELPDFDIDFEGLVVYDADALNGSVLFTDDRNIDLPEFNNISLSLDLSIQSISLGSQESIDVNGVTYEDVIGSEFIVSLGVSATTTIPPLPFPITIEVIQFQEVVKSTNYFADQVGLVQSETNLSIAFSDELNQIPDFNLENILVLIEQELVDFQVTVEE